MRARMSGTLSAYPDCGKQEIDSEEHNKQERTGDEKLPAESGARCLLRVLPLSLRL